MGGQSSSTQTQQSTTNPWAQATPDLTGILGQVGSGLGNTGVTGAENSALGQITSNAGNYGSTFAPQISNFAQTLFNGGGATNQAPAVQQNYDAYRTNTQPIANNTDYNPYNTPGFSNAIGTMTNDITNNVNGSFAAAGRDFSGANQGAVARGVAQGIAPTIASQYNTNVTNQRGAANDLYGAGNTNSGILSGLQQQHLANQGQGAGVAGASLDASNAAPNATLQAEAQRRGIPVQALGLLAQIGIPIAGLGGTSSGTSQGTQQMSGAQQFGMIANGIGSLGSGLFGGGANGSGLVPGISKLISDRRAKEDIAQVGTLFDGTPVYRFRYIGQPAYQIGLMAQDIEKVTPEAVGQIGQFKAVDYKLATDKALEVA